MPLQCTTTLPASQRTPLAACIAALLGISTLPAYATTFVTNCNDAGAGSLRAAVASAPSGDTIDASGLAGVCSTITLKTGDIVVPQTSLTIKGPGADKLTVTAKYGPTSHQYMNRLFTHLGNGTLTLQNVALSKGYQVSAAGNASGGCVYSKGNVSLYKVNAAFCSTHTTTGSAGGGALYVLGNVSMKYSNLTANAADGGSGGRAVGAAVLNGGTLGVKYSTISSNSAAGASGHATGIGGAIYSLGGNGSSLILGSTISGNSSGNVVGGIAMLSHASGAALSIENSTISGNTANAASGLVGGLYVSMPAVKIYNSTIAFNSAATATPTASPGMAVAAYSPPGGSMTPPGTTLTMQSNIFSNNTYGSGSSNDLSTAGSGSATVTITGSNNLVRVSTASLPADTITGQCPLLKPLKNNGGLTQTHGLYARSPAIDHGSNPLALHEDQRGKFSDTSPYPFPRESGPPGGAAVADIGAFEVDQSDEIYDSGFEGCG